MSRTVLVGQAEPDESTFAFDCAHVNVGGLQMAAAKAKMVSRRCVKWVRVKVDSEKDLLLGRITIPILQSSLASMPMF